MRVSGMALAVRPTGGRGSSAQGWVPKIVSAEDAPEIMGHASITTTLDLYGTCIPARWTRYADRLGSAAEEAGKAKIRPDDTGEGTGLVVINTLT